MGNGEDRHTSGGGRSGLSNHLSIGTKFFRIYRLICLVSLLTIQSPRPHFTGWEASRDTHNNFKDSCVNVFTFWYGFIVIMIRTSLSLILLICHLVRLPSLGMWQKWAGAAWSCSMIVVCDMTALSSAWMEMLQNLHCYWLVMEIFRSVFWSLTMWKTFATTLFSIFFTGNMKRQWWHFEFLPFQNVRIYIRRKNCDIFKNLCC